MSIINISSEPGNRLRGGTDAKFDIKIKKPLQRIIGMQLLNVTIPLSYNIINAENRNLYFSIGNNSDAPRNGIYTAHLQTGTYGPHEMAKKLADQINEAAGFPHPHKSQNFYDFCVDNKQLEFTVKDGPYNKYWNNHPSKVYGYSNERDFSGFEVENDNDGILHQIIEYNTSTGAASTDVGPITVDTDTIIKYKGVCVVYDEARTCFVFGIDTGYITINSTNSTRMLKTIGFTGTEGPASVSTLTNHSDYKIFGDWILTGTQTPELSGPSLIFMRIGGDILLDQQNTETGMNDRIPIPIDQAHGGVVHFENDSESDVIPFSVPCDISMIKFRFEYGDDNEIVGGATSNFRGHHVYVRLKFIKEHQQSGKKL